MKNSLRRIFALALVVMMIAALGMSAMAAEGDPVNSITFKKFVTKNDADNVYEPNTTYTFTIKAADADKDGLSNTDAIYAGSLDAVAFAGGENDTLVITSTPVLGVKEYTGTINIDASKFDHSGIFRYVVEETEGNYAGISYDTAKRYLDIYVVEDGVVDNKITYKAQAAVLYKADADNIKEAKEDGFTNVYTTTTLTVSKTVTGNMGEKNKEFSFSLTINGANGEKYKVQKFKGETAVGEAQEIVATNTDNSAPTGTVTTEITLKDGEKFVVYGLSNGDSYVVEETDYSEQGYTTTVVGDKEGNIGESAVTVKYTNDKNFTPPTGIAMTVLPFVAMLAMAAVVAILFFRKKERREA